MKHTIYVIAALAAAAGLRAQSPAPASSPGYSITSDFTYASEYVFRGVKSAGNSFQPSVELAAGDFNVGVWTNQPITKHQNNEIDFYTGYTYKVNTALKLEAVATSYNYFEAGNGQTKDTYEGGLGATYTIAGFSPSVYYYHDFRLNSDTVQGAIGYSLPLEAIGASLDTSLFAGTVNARDTAPDAAGPKPRDAYTYYGIDMSVPYKLNKNATWTTGVHYTTNSNVAGVGGPTGTLSARNIWFTTGISIGF
jgi:uncharacterized protein (TIGR02001 family)